MDYYQAQGGELVVTLRIDTQLLKSLVFCSSILGVKYLISSVFATFVQNKDEWHSIDAILGENVNKGSYGTLRRRFQRMLGSDLETVPFGLAMLWLAGLATSSSSTAEPSTSQSKAAITLVQLTQAFTISSLIQSVSSYAGAPVLKNISFLGGFLSSCAAGIMAMRGIVSL